ncbi:speckle-type POZ protein-like [Argiope bruennichi]|uniref:speckle-type POZ protein-like n=1 Tax=Argiope bruennichi TaxID=94029 RepID=UPI0024950DA9|nr:speckle-type POZ protein-like [Argiope bruennichi]
MEDVYGCREFLLINDVLQHQKADYLAQDILSVRCKIRKGEGSIHSVGQSTARTRIGMEKISFLHKLESFSALEPNQKKTLQLPSRSKTDCIISSSVYLTGCTCHDEKIMVEIRPDVSSYILFKLKLYLLDGSGNNTKCGEIDRFDATLKDIQKLPLSLTRQKILSRKSEFLPNDELSLLCECTFSTGVELEKIEEIRFMLPVANLNQNFYNLTNKDIYNTAEKLSACSSALNDLKTIYDNQCFTDVELKTKTKSFPAHKLVLCARSSVFKAMLTSNMMEKHTDCIRVDDLENDTVQQLLLFLYSDELENLVWESAVKLYYAADKYAVEKLKVLCSSVLVNNISTTTASEVLLLADKHNDLDLKNFVEDFILEHEEEIFASDEWEKLIETDPQLVIKTMHLKYKRKKGGK